MEKLLNSNDLAKIGCNDCKGCSTCCQNMGQSIVLNPYDVYRLCIGIGKKFEEILGQYIELHVEQGIILPNMRMHPQKNQCMLLNEEGRCSEHAFRPGLCRLFPLGRNYENGSFQYFVLDQACPSMIKTKVKISKWLSEPNLRQNEEFLITWHYFIKDMQKVVEWLQNEPEKSKKINMLILQEFFMKPYDDIADFYFQFKERKEFVDQELKKLS